MLCKNLVLDKGVVKECEGFMDYVLARDVITLYFCPECGNIQGEDESQEEEETE